MKPGISSYTYTWAVGVPESVPQKPLSAYDLVEKTFSSELSVVQIADNLPLEDWSSQNLLDLRDYAGNRKISIEMAGRELTAEHTLKCLETAVKLKSSILRMVIDGQDYKPDLQSTISLIRDLVPEFSSRKIRLAIENHDRFKSREFEKIINTVASEWVGICLDSVNSMGAGEGFETVSGILIPYTINLHLKDFTIYRVSHKMGLIIEGKPAGKGMLNIPELVSKVSETGNCQSAILELWTPPEPTMEQTIEKERDWADVSIAYLKNLFDI